LLEEEDLYIVPSTAVLLSEPVISGLVIFVDVRALQTEEHHYEEEEAELRQSCSTVVTALSSVCRRIQVM
jgi:hypothetical protein